ncbi:MAG: phytoene/squalene synthase family protein [Chlorobi bacterium]|nr:phytoene/squalene synthase family protein [Chlorobiota bacterium]MCI0716501.1 phytoene/squalene synthase family protein [Chlorobiota bacterium]
MNGILQADLKTNPLICGYDECKNYTRTYAKSFYFTSFLLPREKRNAAYAVYTFCRYTDNIVDLKSSGINIDVKFEGQKKFLDEVYSGKEFTCENFSAFAETVRRYSIPQKYFLELIEGVQMDVRKKRYSTFAELESYCYKVASVVGLIMTEIFGYSHNAALPYAIYLGKAMQLTNILRDVYEDYNMGRIYLPQQEMKTFEYSEQNIGGKVLNENFALMMKFNIDRARAYYELASHGIPYLTNDGSRTAVVLMYKIYSGILTEIENHNYDIFSQRRYVGTAEKLKMTGMYLLNMKERKKYSIVPDVRHHERIRALYPSLNFDD